MNFFRYVPKWLLKHAEKLYYSDAGSKKKCKPSKNDQPPKEPTSLEEFRKLKPDVQDQLLKKKLIEFQEGLPSSQYHQFVRAFYANFTRSKYCMEKLWQQRKDGDNGGIYVASF